MSGFDCDLFVVGGGSGGVRAARMAAQRGARVVLAEAAALGGTCVNVGCIPKKLYSHAAEYADHFRDAAGFGWDLAPARLDWERLKKNRAHEIARLNGVYEHLLRSAGVDLVRGWATLCDAHTVQVAHADGARRWRARHILVATGGTPSVPHFPGREHVLTSDQMFDLAPFPRRLVVVGGGYIACEFASIFQGLGAQVTQSYRGEQILRGFDDEVRTFLAQEMVKHGVDLRLRSDVEAVERQGDALAVRFAGGEVLEADAVLYATGRIPNVAGLGLEAAGLRTSPHGAIVVDERFRTQVPSILAVGDVIARVQLTPVALAEAMVVVDQLFGTGERSLGYELVPTAVFTHPTVGTVGLTEQQARERHGDVRIFRTDFRALRHTLSGNPERTLMKLVVDAATDRVVGLHMVGAEAGEVVQGFAVAMQAGATKAVFDRTIGIHPTAAEEFVTMREPVVAKFPGP
ncbi:glutathione-disulfide reductase [Ramlibacter sp. USB13]|uniref:Glutathione-disulfide reductase n=1 Tax=Ramlibacter cellulosilyticus TaxID=2764187 RepID=A0A923MTZ9_9BURK|nr:glutathione-disulfide reductase [Ramlibacter cellulosilyticus]MBC5785145.1 glutathione-disulfide reductase [Ramlibacter cellulosilyticus]